jgi:alcohol dehydrogenase
MIGFRLPTRTHIAPGCLAELPDIVSSLAAGRVMLVVDAGLQSTAWPQQAVAGLRSLGVDTEIFDQVEANPTTDTVERIAELVREKGIELVVGLGGGSVLDAAKAAAMVAPNAGPVERYEGKNRYSAAPLPMVAIPTTCGTGSEVTWVSVLSHRPTRSKISVKGEAMYPDQALVDAELLATLPSHLVAWTGIDALTHALEATTCTAANPVSDALAEAAISLLLRFLPRAANDIAGDAEAREAVMRASTLAGISFGSADVAGVHCLSETVGGLYDVAHGLANAILLTPVLRYHQRFIEERLAALNRCCLEPESREVPVGEGADQFLSRLEELSRELAVPPFSSFEIAPDDYPEIAERAAGNGSNSSNPQPMAAPQYLELLESLR